MDSVSLNGVLQGSYQYDYAGRQVLRSLASGVTIQSVFDSMGRRIAEYDQATGALIREYIWMAEEPVAVIEGGVISYVRVDHIGRPVFATDASGIIVWTAAYDPFGTLRASTGTPINLRFPGQWFQAESGLHQNWMRDYDPTTGRYLQADPLGLIDGPSIYGYAWQNPVRWTDPTGEFIPLVWIIGGIIVGEALEYAIEYCGCETSARDRWLTLGTTAEVFGPTIKKPFRAFGSSSHSSLFSAAIGETGLRQSRIYAARQIGKRIAKRLPAIAYAMVVWDAGRLLACLAEKGSNSDYR